MRKIFLAVVACIASVVSAKTSVAQYTSNTIDLIQNSQVGSAVFGWGADFGYAFNTAISYPDESNVALGATFGLYSNIDFTANINLLNLFNYNLKVTLTPATLTPFNAAFTFTHPLAMAEKGAQMDAKLDVGYLIDFGNIATYYYINSLLPKVSIYEMLNASGIYIPALPSSNALNNAAGVNGWDWNIDANGAWSTDPYFKFNLLEYVNKNVEGVYVEPTGSFLNVDFFAEAEEYM